jgi:hypothetical protein
MSNISCIEFGRLVEQAVESQSAVDSTLLRAHAAECAGCRATWLDALLLDGAVAEWRKTGKKILPSVDLADIVLARRTSGLEPVVSTDITPFAPQSGIPQHANTGADDRVVAAGAVAVADLKPTRTPTRQRIAASTIVLAVAASVAFFWNRAGRQNEIVLIPKTAPVTPDQTLARTDSPPIVATSNARQALAVAPSRDHVAEASIPAPPAEAPVQAMVEGAQSAYRDLANEAAKAVTGATALIPRPDLASVMAPSHDENDRWVDDVGHQFEPVGKNLSQAFQFIFEAVPADKAPAT